MPVQYNLALIDQSLAYGLGGSMRQQREDGQREDWHRMAAAPARHSSTKHVGGLRLRANIMSER
jgi:hypothetical protein